MPRLQHAFQHIHHKEWSGMPKPSSTPKPDPMSGVVDRLLAQLPGLQSEPSNPTRKVTTAGQWTTPTAMSGRRDEPVTLVWVWARVLLGLSLGVMMGAWPYQKNCGQPLAAYLGAILILGLAGLWAASAAWKRRAALAHVVALSILFYAFLLAAAEVLPRTGYAAQHAGWRCEETLGWSAVLPRLHA
jgi:hypothetical protein